MLWYTLSGTGQEPWQRGRCSCRRGFMGRHAPTRRPQSCLIPYPLYRQREKSSAAGPGRRSNLTMPTCSTVHWPPNRLESGLEPEGFEVPLHKLRAEAKLYREVNVPLLAEERKLSLVYDAISGART